MKCYRCHIKTTQLKESANGQVYCDDCRDDLTKDALDHVFKFAKMRTDGWALVEAAILKPKLKVYRVVGDAGDYEIQTNWTVKVFRSKEKADEYAAKAQERAKQWDANVDDPPDSWSEFDDYEECIARLGEVTYCVSTLEIEDE